MKETIIEEVETTEDNKEEPICTSTRVDESPEEDIEDPIYTTTRVEE